ncbi:Ig-like domain-containing protein [Halalkalibacter sp. AB-rgal2]|uniref:Ig-like domain-containing protein n=1 Tax=Halalkalibacter sp. AB-rgal2 TaxID=3242695 RepID=UPI00359DBF5D
MSKRNYFKKKIGLVSLVLLLVYSSVLPIEIVIAEDEASDVLITEEEEGLLGGEGNVKEEDEELDFTSDIDKEEDIEENDDKDVVKDLEIKQDDHSWQTSQVGEAEDGSVMELASISSTMYSGGDGSAGNPYVIETAEQLNEVRNNLNAHYQLENDIDLAAYSSGQGWVPIGVSSNQFNGTLDGNGHVITNLTIDRSNTRQDDQGLFGVIGENGVVKNVSLENIEIGSNQGFSIGGLVGLNYGEISGVSINSTVEGRYYVGGLVGRNYGDVSQAYAEGLIFGFSRVGGLIGENDGNVIQSSAEAYVNGDDFIGGLVGLNLSNGNGISQSFAKSTVKGNLDVGGLVGQNQNTIVQSYAESTVEGYRNIGGLIGNQSWSNKKVSESYSNSLVTGNESIGGLVGLKHDVATIEASYWNRSVENGGSLDNGFGAALTEEELKQFSKYDDWDTTNTWYVYHSQTFPLLQWENPLEEVEVDIDFSELKVGEIAQLTVTANHQEGSFDGTIHANYKVTEGDHVVEVDKAGVVTANESGEAVITVTLYDEVATMKVTVEEAMFADGDGSAGNPYIIMNAEQLDAVREDVVAHYRLGNDIDLAAYLSGESWEPIDHFNGTFDGAGYQIKGLKIDGNNIHSIHLGMFARLYDSGVIKNVTLVDLDINGSRNIGGLVGVAFTFARIENSSVTGSLSGSNEVGGLVGVNFGMISGSVASTTISVSDSSGGGLVGQNGGEIKNSYASGEISGDSGIGGLVGGHPRDFNNRKIINSYSNSIVTGNNDIGGLVGYVHDPTFIVNSYWNTSVYDGDYPDNGIGTPLTEEQLKQFNTYTNWDFTNTWYVYNGQTFPFLQWENPLEEVEVDIDLSKLKVGETSQLTVTANHQDGSFDGTIHANYEVTEGDQFVDVDQNGIVTAKESGEAVITVTLYGEVNTIDVTVVEPLFTEGDGTADNPYIITTPEQLDGVRENLEAYYQLGADIDLVEYLSGESWEPIGRAGTPFIGTFDGDGYEITGLQFDNEFRENSGLFSALKNPGVIKNVTLVDVDIKATRHTVGGLVGINLGTGRIENSSVTGTVSGGMNVGGLVGINNGLISESVATTTTSARSFRSGGLVGLNSGEIINSYANGRVSGDERVGGLVGEHVKNNNISKISESYSSSIVTGNNNVGGLVGSKDDSAYVEHSYWNKSVYNGDYPDNEIGTPLTEAELKQLSTFSNWDFTNTWYIYNDQTFPILQWENPIKNIESEIDSSEIKVGKMGRISVTAIHLQGTYDGTQNAEYKVTEGDEIVDVDHNGIVTPKESGHAVITVTLYGEVSNIDVTVVELFTEGDGTVDHPYIITTAEQLNAVREDLGAHYKLGHDIDLAAYLSGESWEPLGDDQLAFEGTFNGEGYEIKGLNIDGRLDVQGLFGGLGNTGVIKNVNLVDVNIEGNSIIGGLVAYSYPSAHIENSTVTGTLSGSSNVGGLVGMNYGMIHESAAHTTIQLSNINGGGLVGINYGSIIKSYAIGEISGRNSIGGLVGSYFVGRDNSKVSESYSSSIVTGDDHVGGLVGLLTNDSAIIEHSYWNKSVYGGDYPDNGYGIPITEAELKQLSTFTNWDFTNTWYVYNDQVFPFLQWENSLESVEVKLDSSTLQIGNSTQITVTAHHEEGSFDGTSNAEYEVTIGDDLISIDEDGQVTATAPGNAEITVQLFGEVSTHEIEVLSYQISRIEEFQPITVDNGTEIDHVGLPTTIQVTVSPGDVLRDIKVQWTDADEDNPYDANKAGTYTFIGTLVDIPGDVRNPNHLTALIDVIVDVPFITDVEAIDSISVENGTKRADLTLPDEVHVTLNNGETAQIGVSWDNGEPLYDELKAGTYMFTGTFELSEGVIEQVTTFVASLINSEFDQPLKVGNPDNITATVEVVVQKPFITEVEQLAAIHVANGTELSEVGLPDQVNVTLNNGHDLDVYVDWNEGVPEYAKMTSGVYQFKGVLKQPEEIENPDQKAAVVDVVVGEPIITEVGTIKAIHVANGTEHSELNLPEQVEVTVNNGSTIHVGVTWDKGEPTYNGMRAGTYLFAGKLELPTGVLNPDNKQAEVEVEVDKPFITEVESLRVIQVENGTKLSEIGFAEQVMVTLNNGEKKTINVTWDEGGPDYNGLKAGTYRITGSLEALSRIENPNNIRAVAEVKVGRPYITEVETLEIISVANGTNSEEIGLPKQVEVTLNNGGQATVDVKWDEGVPKYDGKKAGVYQFTGTFNQLNEIENPNFKQAAVEVKVDQPTIVEVGDLGDIAIISVANGTKRSDLELPEKVEVILNNGETTEIDVMWDDGQPPYDEKKAGTYTFTGTFVLTEGMFSSLTTSIATIFTSEWNLSNEIQNPEQLMVTIDVQVHEPFISEIERFERIHVENGIKRKDLDLPPYVEVVLNNGEKMNVHVNWDEGVPKYNEKQSGTYLFNGTLEQLSGIENRSDEQVTIEVIVGDPIVMSVERFEDITVVNGTKRIDLNLPSSIEVLLNNGETIEVNVTWNDGKPQYDGMRAGSYVFIGTLDQLTDVLNPSSIHASLTVYVSEKDDPVTYDPHPEDPEEHHNKNDHSPIDQGMLRREHEEYKSMSDDEEELLPKTATPHFKILLIGFFLVVLSRVLLFLKRKQLK